MGRTRSIRSAAGLRRTLGGGGALFGLAAVCAIAATIYLVGLVTSTTGLLWVGHQVHGSETSGVVTYSYGAHTYVIDDGGSYRSGARTVYIDTGDPSRAVLDRAVARYSEALFVVVPYAAAVAFGSAGVRRRRRNRRRMETAMEDPSTAFGFGLDPDAVRKLLEARRAEASNRVRGVADPKEE